MESQNIAIVGSGNVGETFLDGVLRLKDKGVQVVGVVDTANPPSSKAGVKHLTMEEMVALGEGLDIIFDLSGDREVRRELRKTLFGSGNQHTVIANESVARLVWTLLGDTPFPDGLSNAGY